ncbi:hypothetical protein JCGZ_09036 [Jatropha curcas]|uniref:Uncharacterized protein n=1 Tax=Jatropha curcas TaxID=180498 RepID=A0A067KKR8_JATCU|nr:hypothetical protein JCGZ_09036 [Jatropha curcas]
MSETRRSRHQRRPSQTVMLSFSNEDLSAPLSDNGGNKNIATPATQPPSQQIFTDPLPPTAEAAEVAPKTAVKDDEKEKDVSNS